MNRFMLKRYFFWGMLTLLMVSMAALSWYSYKRAAPVAIAYWQRLESWTHPHPAPMQTATVMMGDKNATPIHFEFYSALSEIQVQPDHIVTQSEIVSKTELENDLATKIKHHLMNERRA
jgi:hypothetical protein